MIDAVTTLGKISSPLSNCWSNGFRVIKRNRRIFVPLHVLLNVSNILSRILNVSNSALESHLSPKQAFNYISYGIISRPLLKISLFTKSVPRVDSGAMLRFNIAKTKTLRTNKKKTRLYDVNIIRNVISPCEIKQKKILIKLKYLT